MRTSISGPPRGFALPVALMSIVVIGALIAGAFFSSTQENRVGRNSLAEQRAFTAAEHGLGAVADTLTTMFLTDLPVGDPRVNVVSFYDSTGGTAHRSTDSIRVTKLSPNLVLVTSVGNLNSGAARRQTSMILRFALPQFSMPGALTVAGALTIGGSSQISGFDNAPPSWDEDACPNDDGGKAGIATQPGVTIKINGSGCEDLKCVEAPSDKQLQTAAAADTSTYFVYGNTTWTELVKLANVKLEAGNYKPFPATTVIDGRTVCTNTSLNWGEPWHDDSNGPNVDECVPRYPIIYINGSAKLNAGARGQGILLVNGDLSLSGGFEFAGPIILRGDLKTTGSNIIRGSVSAANVDLDKESSVALGDPTINYSNCAIQTAISASIRPQLIKNRSWVEMFQ